MESSKKKLQFKLFAQNRGDILVVEDLSNNSYFHCTANEILLNQEWSDAFSERDKAVIRGVAEVTASYGNK